VTLLQIRTKFVDLSGRFDLVVNTTSYADNGANFFIQAGLRLLDSLQDTHLAVSRYQKDLAVGDSVLDVPSTIRSIKEVWIVDPSTTQRALLTKQALGYMKENYPKSVANTTRGTPVDWARTVNLLAPSQLSLTTSAGASPYTAQFSNDFEDLILANEAGQHLRSTILFGPPADKAYTMIVYAKFFSVMSAETDVCYWSEVYPELVVMAASWAVETFYRNTEGAQDWLAQIQNVLLGVDKDLVDEDVSGVSQIGE
jgi:hypothetical protein